MAALMSARSETASTASREAAMELLRIHSQPATQLRDHAARGCQLRPAL